MEVDANLYEVLKENETGLHMRGRDVIAYVHLSFYDLKDFVEAVGEYCFDEGGLVVHMFLDSICVELNEIIEGKGHNISSYIKCFDEDTWSYYVKEIKEMESR